jgi:cytochrome c biogenesis protein CcdA/glutaredoxin
MKKILTLFYILSVFFLFGGYINHASASNSVNAYLFYGEGCPHCAKEKAFFETIKDKYPSLKIVPFEVYYNSLNSSLLESVAQNLNIKSGGVPFLIIGDVTFVGYSDSISPKQIEGRIKECLFTKCPDSVAKIVGIDIVENSIKEVKIDDSKNLDDTFSETDESGVLIEKEEKFGKSDVLEKTIKIPFFGEVSIKNFSLPLLTIVIAFLDGFNPCAMWVLLFLVSLLFGIENKKRLWTFGLVFLFSSAVVYFLFMTAWLNLFMFLGFIAIIRIIIGIIALLSAYFNLKEYITNPTGGCKVTGGEKRQRIFEKLKQIIQQKNLVIAILGLVLLAFAVNLVELVCSLGLPAVYTQVLSLSDLSVWQYYLYLVFYVLIFILPAFIVFAISATTLQLTGISTKYGRLIHLISGIIMLVLGVLMIFKPEWLMFG